MLKRLMFQRSYLEEIIAGPAPELRPPHDLQRFDHFTICNFIQHRCSISRITNPLQTSINSSRALHQTYSLREARVSPLILFIIPQSYIIPKDTILRFIRMQVAWPWYWEPENLLKFSSSFKFSISRKIVTIDRQKCWRLASILLIFFINPSISRYCPKVLQVRNNHSFYPGSTITTNTLSRGFFRAWHIEKLSSA